jgi:hypothetical protein
MVEAYNFLAGWQLFPEKCVYKKGIAPKSGTYKIEAAGNLLTFANNWVTVEDAAYNAVFTVIPDGEVHTFDNAELAAQYSATFVNSGLLQLEFLNAAGITVLQVTHEILHNGWLKVTQQQHESGSVIINTDVYHKQLSILPYAASSSSVVIRPTKEGVIKHKALSAMEEQTNMQLYQIRQQIELLAKQAAALQQRKELSLKIYESKLNFKPQIGQTYHLYQQKNDSFLLSMIAPGEWGGNGPFKAFISSVKLLADHTWMEVTPD